MSLAELATTLPSNFETTRDFTQDTASDVMCNCICKFVNTSSVVNPTSVDLDFIEDLKVSPEELSSEMRKKISASDPRASSTVIGSFGVVILVSVLTFIVLLDLMPPRRLCVKLKFEKAMPKSKAGRRKIFEPRKNQC